jgi:SAM-dependent methyltransferase
MHVFLFLLRLIQGLKLMINCRLCNDFAVLFYRTKKKEYFICGNCRGIFPDEKLLPDVESETKRYLSHNNDPRDKGYQAFVSPLVNAVLNDFSPNDKGLDFGAGTGPVVSELLTGKNYHVVQYDPLFHDQRELLSGKYDYIVCCEVIEHFHHPGKEFALLRGLLHPRGKLYCMTSIYNPGIDFETWYYKNDFTHVFFYQQETILWISEKYGFTGVLTDNNLVVFST